jgi:hypothetical protein
MPGAENAGGRADDSIWPPPVLTTIGALIGVGITMTIRGAVAPGPGAGLVGASAASGDGGAAAGAVVVGRIGGGSSWIPTARGTP